MPRLYLPIYGYPGNDVCVDPVTYEPRLVHPILEVHSSHCSVKTDIMQWLIEYYGDTPDDPVRVGFDGIAGDYYIDFDTEQDLTWFKLRWLA